VFAERWRERELILLFACASDAAAGPETHANWSECGLPSEKSRRSSNSPEETIHRWIESGEMPAHRIHDQYRVNRSELLEWATSVEDSGGAGLFHEATMQITFPPRRVPFPRRRVSRRAGDDPFEALSEIVRHLLSEGTGNCFELLLARAGAAARLRSEAESRFSRPQADRACR
jgi:excisionase family DNA binding protein